MSAISFRVLRPSDLVDLHVSTVGLQLASFEAKPHLVPDQSAPARLIVTFAPQHLTEEATSDADGETPAPSPIRALLAHESRLVFAVPEGERIPFSTVGVLAALGRLPLVVVPAAQPRALERIGPSVGSRVAALADGVLRLSNDNLLTLTAAELSSAVPPATPASRLVARAVAMRTARTLLADTAAIEAREVVEATPPTPTPGPVRGPISRLPVGRQPLRERVGRIGSVLERLPRLDLSALTKPPEVRAPKADETAIEAPWRLFISPSEKAGFAHSVEPVHSLRSESLVELWHTRLGVRSVSRGGEVTVDERNNPQRIIRAIWARDKEGTEPTTTDNKPFRMSLCGLDRVMLVRQSAGTPQLPRVKPEPVAAKQLALSALGAWLDLHGVWKTEAYSAASLPSIVSWDHLAPMGRDQFVQVVYPGFLMPFGHRAVLVKITERKIREAVQPRALLYQRKFLMIAEPERLFEDRRLPFVRVAIRPLQTPDIKDPAPTQDLFWPTLPNNEKFEFVLDAVDQDMRAVRLHTPLLFMAEAYAASPAHRTETINEWSKWAKDHPIAASGQRISFAPSARGGETTLVTVSLTMAMEFGSGTLPRSVPKLAEASVVIPAMRQLTKSAAPLPMSYASSYVQKGFVPGADDAEVFMAVVGSKGLVSFSDSTDRSGGFLSPNLPIAGLSRKLGLASNVSGSGPQFDAASFTDALPKLFGLIKLSEILKLDGLGAAPSFVQDLFDTVTGFLRDLDHLVELVDEAVKKGAAAISSALTALQGFASSIPAAIEGLASATSIEDAQAALDTLLGSFLSTLTTLSNSLASLPIPVVLTEQIRARLEALRKTLSDVKGFIDQCLSFLAGLLPKDGEVRARFEWKPKISSWPSTGDPVFIAQDPYGLVLAVETRASGASGAGAYVLAELRNFALSLLPGAELMRLEFERISFRSGTGRSPEVDVVLKQREFLGVLGYLAKLSEWIPFDGFSDPPFFDVSAAGIRAGFSVALPSIAVGVFSLENMSFAADVNVPFLGEAITVGFQFCSRESPFVLTVCCLGGGGFVGLRLSAEKLVLLEASLEARAQLSVDFGVASGSISAAVGIYLRLEGKAGSLTGYFRLRGEVNVLGIISASIELYLELVYEFGTGKLVGRARLTIEVEVFCFSVSVSFEVERRFAGSAGDPTFRELLGADLSVASERWSTYCLAFAGA